MEVKGNLGIVEPGSFILSARLEQPEAGVWTRLMIVTDQSGPRETV